MRGVAKEALGFGRRRCLGLVDFNHIEARGPFSAVPLYVNLLLLEHLDNLMLAAAEPWTWSDVYVRLHHSGKTRLAGQ
jgi:hypothetical protein